MEKFVDRIIETARKAREIIEQAQQEKQAVLAAAKKRADAEIARRETEADKGRAAIDEEFAQREARESERMDAAYLDAKVQHYEDVIHHLIPDDTNLVKRASPPLARHD